MSGFKRINDPREIEIARNRAEDHRMSGTVEEREGKLTVTFGDTVYTIRPQDAVGIKPGDKITFEGGVIPHPSGGENNGPWNEYFAHDVRRV